MSDETRLSELCSICNINTSKYCCPGCAARTCSLPCYKRHQQWAQCSGKRDPTKFVKKSQLVTPAGIDHDFNFLSGIERNLEKAERAVSATDTPPVGHVARHHGRINYHRLEAAGVKVIRAPQGMSRQRENRSHISKTKKANKNIVWTVEWLNLGKDRIVNDTSCTARIGDANPFSQRIHERTSKKRKLANDKPQTAHPTTHSKANELDLEPTQISQPDASDPLADQLHGSLGTSKQEENIIKKEMTPSPDDRAPATTPESSEQHFYLLRPRTSSARHVLIPLDPLQTLGESLRGHTVLEFPTIYVFPSSLSPLPKEYMLQDEYLKQEGEEQKELDQLLQELDPAILKRLKEDGAKREAADEDEVDSKKILDVLKQDLGGAL